jgi:hypothetical protein
MAKLEIDRGCVIKRPIEVVRSHFLDFDHHIARGVHAGVRYQVLSASGGKQRVRQMIRVLGLPKVDVIEVGLDGDGNVRQDFLEGDFAGGHIEVHFRALDATTTELRAQLRAPLRGLNALMAPIVRRVVEKLTEQAIREDQDDLERKGYQPPVERRAA